MTDPVTTVTVSVQTDGSIVCAPNPVVVTDPDTMLNFQLLGSTHAFRNRHAITVSGGGSEFPFPSWTTKDNQALLLDRVASIGDFDYTLHLVETASGKSIRIDPTIRNEPN